MFSQDFSGYNGRPCIVLGCVMKLVKRWYLGGLQSSVGDTVGSLFYLKYTLTTIMLTVCVRDKGNLSQCVSSLLLWFYCFVRFFSHHAQGVVLFLCVFSVLILSVILLLCCYVSPAATKVYLLYCPSTSNYVWTWVSSKVVKQVWPLTCLCVADMKICHVCTFPFACRVLSRIYLCEAVLLWMIHSLCSTSASEPLCGWRVQLYSVRLSKAGVWIRQEQTPHTQKGQGQCFCGRTASLVRSKRWSVCVDVCFCPFAEQNTLQMWDDLKFAAVHSFHH